MAQNQKPLVFFHVGLGKTASTYLQYAFFPKLNGIHYVQRTQYKNYDAILQKAKYDTYFFSREFDRQFNDQVIPFSEKYPDTFPIIILRRQDSWIASQYRRYVKNGRHFTFKEFIDVENNNGAWDRKHLLYYPKIETLRKVFNKEPLILLYDELRKDPRAFFDKIAAYTGSTYDFESISLNPAHKSYSQKQLKVLRKLSKHLFHKSHDNYSSVKFIHWIQYRSRWALCHFIMYFAWAMPKSAVPQGKLIDPKDLEEVKKYTEEDWQLCLKAVEPNTSICKKLVMKAGFFTSTGRTGTDFFTTLFNDAIEDSWSLHEPHPAFRRRARHLMSKKYTPYEYFYFQTARRRRHLMHKETWYVETNYHLFAAIPLIRKTFPNGVVIHIVRDGRAVVTSWLNRYRYVVDQHISPFNIPGDPAQELWENWNPLQKLSWYWKTVNSHILTTPPDMVVKFREIFTKNPEESRVFEILEKFKGLEYDRQKVIETLQKPINKNKVEFYPKYPEWPQAWKDQFWDIAGEQMEYWGYQKTD